LNPELRDICLDVWTRLPLPERRQASVKLSDAIEGLHSGPPCFIAFENTETVLLADDVSSDIVWDHAPVEFEPFSNLQPCLLTFDMGELLVLPENLVPGESLYVSTSSGEDHCWATLVHGCLLGELNLGAVHTRKILEAASERVGFGFEGMVWPMLARR
jgi:hypothetical protein